MVLVDCHAYHKITYLIGPFSWLILRLLENNYNIYTFLKALFAISLHISLLKISVFNIEENTIFFSETRLLILFS